MHLFDLSRIGEVSAPDIIEKIGQHLPLTDRLAWNDGKEGAIERRTFGA